MIWLLIPTLALRSMYAFPMICVFQYPDKFHFQLQRRWYWLEYVYRLIHFVHILNVDTLCNPGGGTSCVSGSVCTVLNSYYSQCLPGTATSSSSSSTHPSSSSSSAPSSTPTSTLPRFGGVNTAGYDFSVVRRFIELYFCDENYSCFALDRLLMVHSMEPV